ncbi:MAG TPA: MFS transporter [Anaerolineales bacterium]|nr:MFS transporter [Anaerolineales bacterium]
MNQAVEFDLARAGRRIVAALFAVQSLSFAAVIAMATVFSIVAADLTGNPAWAGAPSALTSLSGGLAAPLLAAAWDRWGRRLGLSLALALGVLGAGAAAASVELHSVWLFGLGILILGASQSGARLSRFIAAEVTPPEGRGRAISLVVWGGAIGAVGGPLLVGPSSRLAAGLGWNELSGPIALGVPLIVLSVVVCYAGLRPEPLELSRRLERQPTGQAGTPARPLSHLLLQPGILVAVAAVVLSQMVMVMLMGITSLYMRDHGHTLDGISLVFAAHTLGMFAFSPLAGRFSDRAGRGPVILAGALLMIAAALVTPASHAVPVLALGLFLLGLGWNFCFVAGSALLSDLLSPAERSKTQGANDLLVGLASGIGSLSSGVVYAALGYWTVSLLGGALIVVAALSGAWWSLTRAEPRPAPAE